MASNKKKIADQTLEGDVIEAQEQSTDEEPQASDDAIVSDEAEIEDDEEHVLTPAELVPATHSLASYTPKATPDASNLHARIEQAARVAFTRGDQDQVHALNQAELLTGQLKMVLPIAIMATEDAQLQCALEALFALL